MMIKILLIEDEESLRHMLGAFLVKRGYAVTAADSAASGLSLANECRYIFQSGQLCSAPPTLTSN